MMFSRSISQTLSRVFLAALTLAVVALALPRPASAAYPTFSIQSVKAGESVTIRTSDFPRQIEFTVRMDVIGNRAEGGVVAGATNSGIGGSFDATYPIPEALKSQKWIAIRLESKEGYYAYNYFYNHTSASAATPTPKPAANPTATPAAGAKPSLSFTNLKPNETVTVEARNLPANTTFTVRVGPYSTFFKEYVTAPAVKTDANGFVRFSVTLPAVVKNVEWVTVRLDGAGRYAFNAFKNVAGGTNVPVTSTGACQLVSVTPGVAQPPRADFDAVWTIKNTGNKTWAADSVDYLFAGGTKMHQYNERYDLTKSVKPGETLKIVVDMRAPASSGTYTTRWALAQGSTTLCDLPLTVRVK